MCDGLMCWAMGPGCKGSHWFLGPSLLRLGRVLGIVQGETGEEEGIEQAKRLKSTGNSEQKKHHAHLLSSPVKYPKT